MADVAAVVVAAGQGLRAGGDRPKQFRPIGGQTMLRRTLSLLAGRADAGRDPAGHPAGGSRPVRRGDRRARCAAAGAGGATRQASVRAGLEALEPRAPDVVLIHDAARPFASHALIERAIAAAERTGAAIPGLAVTDTIKIVDSHGMVGETLDRTQLRAIQTPQAFAFAPLLEAHRRAAREGRDDFTDDAALAEWAGMQVVVFDGEPANIKITHAEDFMRAEAMQAAQLGDIRTGSGIDVHAFGPGDARHDRRRAHPAHACFDRPFRRRRRPARAGRRHPRRPGRRRHRLAFSAERYAVEGRFVRQIPRLRGRARASARRHDRASRSQHRLPRRRGSGRIATPCARRSRASPAST